MTGKGRKAKKPAISSSSNQSSAAGPSTTGTEASQVTSDEPYQMTRDMAITVLYTIKDVTDVSGVLAPLKVTCALLIRCLEITKVRDSFIAALKH
jgi:hypothetical protein